jgi:hypothetical protein
MRCPIDILVAVAMRKATGGLSMTKFTPSFTVLATVLALGLHAAPAQAITRTFIASFGNDANPCTRPLPCRLLQAAHNATDNHGEIHALDPAGYGAVTITKSISIINDGTGNAISQAPTSPPYTSITINAANTETITIRGFYLEGAYASNATGIKFMSGSKLNISNCVLHGFMNTAIDFTPTIGPNGANIYASNIVIHLSGTGIIFAPTGSGYATLNLDNAKVYDAANEGLKIDSSGMTGGLMGAHVTESVFANAANGILAKTTSGVTTLARLVRSSVVFSNFGVTADGTGAIVHLSESTIGPTLTGWTILNSGAVESFGDNIIDHNLSGNSAPPTVSKK